ncbi:hypothetical protein AB3M96_16410 [Fredinandcohnia sp. 179-A 10B2 NHS]
MNDRPHHLSYQAGSNKDGMKSVHIALENLNKYDAINFAETFKT